MVRMKAAYGSGAMQFFQRTGTHWVIILFAHALLTVK